MTPNTPPGFFSENVRVEKNYAFVNGPAALMYVQGHKEAAGHIHAVVPDDWRVAVPLAACFVAFFVAFFATGFLLGTVSPQRSCVSLSSGQITSPP